MSHTAKILIVCVSADSTRIRKHIQREASLNGEQLFDILEIAAPLAKDRRGWTAAVRLNTEKIGDFLDDSGINILISNSEYAADWSRLKDSADVILSSSVKLLLKKIKDLLEERKLDWLTTAKVEWAKSELGDCSPEKWWEQFVRLDCKDLGRNLLKLLKVITNRELREAYTLQSSELAGLTVRHAYIKDSDPGSSSQTIAAMLAKMHGEDIIELELDDACQWRKLEADVIYVYEDGLWSGVELVKRVEAIGKSLSEIPSDIAFKFRFAATSDIGLIAARAAARTLKLPSLHFHGMGHDNHFEFLKGGFEFGLLKGMDNDQVRKALDTAVTPYAFSFSQLWGDEILVHMDACQSIGAQLAKPFLERRKRIKNGLGPAAPVVISEEKAKEWSLGALGFGSTVVFATSIPKPVIPLMWLQGAVSFNGNDVSWRPLFLDARRTGVGVHSI